MLTISRGQCVGEGGSRAVYYYFVHGHRYVEMGEELGEIVSQIFISCISYVKI